MRCDYYEERPEISEGPATYSPAGAWICGRTECDGIHHLIQFKTSQEKK